MGWIPDFQQPIRLATRMMMLDKSSQTLTTTSTQTSKIGSAGRHCRSCSPVKQKFIYISSFIQTQEIPRVSSNVPGTPVQLFGPLTAQAYWGGLCVVDPNQLQFPLLKTSAAACVPVAPAFHSVPFSNPIHC